MRTYPLFWYNIFINKKNKGESFFLHEMGKKRKNSAYFFSILSFHFYVYDSSYKKRLLGGPIVKQCLG